MTVVRGQLSAVGNNPRAKPMRRKIFVGLLATVLLTTAPPTQAQQPAKFHQIGYLSTDSPSTIAARIEAFRQGLRELGYVEGKNIVIEWRFAEGKADRLPGLVAELVRLKVDAIVTSGPAATRAAKQATVTIPLSRRRIPILLGTGSSPAWRGLVVTLLDCPLLPRR
jgi:putative tryptophan/tyrosine transport system substrate-binding protein